MNCCTSQCSKMTNLNYLFNESLGMLNFMRDYLLEPVMEGAKKYVLFPIAGALTKIITAAATKNVSSNLTAAVATTIIGPAKPTDPMQLTDATVDRLADLQNKAKRGIAGCVIENAASTAFKLMHVIPPIVSGGCGPASKLLTSVVPKAYNLVLTTSRNASYSKEVVVGVSSHAAGVFMQEGVDALLPQAAPYGGYVAYGIASGLTKVGLARSLRR